MAKEEWVLGQPENTQTDYEWVLGGPAVSVDGTAAPADIVVLRRRREET